MTYSNEEFNYTVNPLGHCWECNQPGHVRIKCPDLGQSRTNYRGGQDQDEDVCYLLPKRMRKEQRSQLLEEDVERIFWEVMKENNWKLKDFAAEETKEERYVSSSIDVERIFWKVMKENVFRL